MALLENEKEVFLQKYEKYSSKQSVKDQLNRYKKIFEVKMGMVRHSVSIGLDMNEKDVLYRVILESLTGTQRSLVKG